MVFHLEKLIGNQCHRKISDKLKQHGKTVTEEKLLTAIKAVANIGNMHGVFTNKSDNSKSLTSALLECLKNSNKSFIIARSAAQALKSIGLQPHIVSELLKVVEDEKQAATLRTAIIDMLIDGNHKETILLLLEILNTTKTENIQMYIVTRLVGLMEGLQPELQDLRAKLGEILKSRVQPPIDDMSLKSHYSQFSHQFTVPVINLNIGGFFTVNLIYTPASNVFQSFILGLGWTFHNKTVHLIDVTIDLQGIDTLLDMKQKSSEHSYWTDPKNILHVLHTLHKYIENITKTEVPNFPHYNNKIKLVINKIFQLVNMQRATFPQVHLSFKLFGYEMGFMSSNSLLLMMKQMNSKNGGQMKEEPGAMTERMLKVILRTFMPVELHKVVPTVSGFPLETRIDSLVLAQTFVNVSQENVIKQGKQMSTNVILRPSMSVYLQATMKVSVGGYISSGVSMRSSFMAVGDWKNVIEYLPPSSTSDLEYNIHVIWQLKQCPFTFFKLRNDKNILHNGVEYLFSLPNLEKTFHKCLPDIYTDILGYKTCVLGTSYDTSQTKLINSSFLVNAFKVNGILTPSDTRLKNYFLNLKFHKSSPQGFQFVARFEGPGKEFSRQITAIIDRNYVTGALDIQLDIPDAGLRYNLARLSSITDDDYHNKYVSILSKHGKTLSSFILEKKSNHFLKTLPMQGRKFMEYNETRKSTHFNISFGALSLDVFYKDHIPRPTNWLTDVTIVYYCEPKLGLLYALHPNPQMAASQDHTTLFSYKQQTFDSKTSFSETWKGNNKMVFSLPGQNIIIKTNMMADLAGAHRVTDFIWEYGNYTDIIHMNSSVHNQSSTDLFKFDYFLHLYSKDKLDIDIEGHVHGPRTDPLAMLNISTDISFSTHGERSEPFLFTLLSEMKSVGTSVSRKVLLAYEATKSKIASLLGGSKPKSGNNETVMDTVDLVTSTGNPNSLLQKYFESLKWDVAIDIQICRFPHILSKPGGKKMKVGSEMQWFVNASIPRGNTKVMVNGSIFSGNMHKMRLTLDDYLHDLKFNWKADYSRTSKIFQHHHEWTLEDTNKHSFDRSFNFTVKFERHQWFEYNLNLRSPRANVIHHINYTRMSQDDHTLCAFADVHSVQPKFDLLYHESSNMTKTAMFVNKNLTSTYWDHQFQLKKLAKPNGIVIDGKFNLLGKFSSINVGQTLSLSILMLKQRPPIMEWIHQYDNSSALSVAFSLIGPQKITVEVKTIEPNVTLPQNSKSSVLWTLDLVDSRYLQHTIEVSPEMSKRIKNTVQKLHKLAPGIIEHLGNLSEHIILADIKDQILPLTNKSVEEFIKAKLLRSMKHDPEGKMAKLYKLSLGGVMTLNAIWIESPIVQLIRGSHMDELLASVLKTFSNTLVQWTHQPPFIIQQFHRIYIEPTLSQMMKSKMLTFLTPLPFVLPAFNRVPQLTSLEKEVLNVVKNRINGATTFNKDFAIIWHGRTIKTFDGRLYQFKEPSMMSCTYLLGADFKYGQFGLTYTREGVTVFTSSYGLTMAQDGSIFSLNSDPIRYLPFSSPDGKLFLSPQNGKLQLSFAEGLVDVTFNPNNNIYMIEFDRKLTNVSVGLLGTNNHEKSDDFLMANGLEALAEEDFQNSYELTESNKCLVGPSPSLTSCAKSDFFSCSGLSDKMLQDKSCQLVLNPQPFIDECHKTECAGQSGCSIVEAYINACHLLGHNVSMPSSCVSDVPRKNSTLDIVIIQSLHKLMVISDEDPFIASRTFLSSYDHPDLSVGLVTFEGLNEWKQPKLHLFNGKLMEKGSKAVHSMGFSIKTGEDNTDADAALIAALNYPFRSQAIKVILLIHQRKPMKGNKDIANLADILRSKGIILVSASTYSELEDNGVPGILEAKDINKHQENRPFPQERYSEVIMSTLGMWLDLDMFNSLKEDKLRKIVEAFDKLGN